MEGEKMGEESIGMGTSVIYREKVPGKKKPYTVVVSNVNFNDQFEVHRISDRGGVFGREAPLVHSAALGMAVAITNLKDLAQRKKR
jgi:hypothetical protein